MAQDGVIAAQRRHRGDVDDRVAARFHQAKHLADRAPLVDLVERVEDVEGSDEVERAARKRRRHDARAREAPAPGLAPNPQAWRAEVEPVRASGRAEPLDVRAGPAAAVEDERRGASGCGDFDERADEGAEAAEPEVPRFRFRGRAQQTFHARDCIVFATGFIDTARSTL